MLYKIKFDEMEDKILQLCLKNGKQPPPNDSKIERRKREVAPPDRRRGMRELAKTMGG